MFVPRANQATHRERCFSPTVTQRSRAERVRHWNKLLRSTLLLVLHLTVANVDQCILRVHLSSTLLPVLHLTVDVITSVAPDGRASPYTDSLRGVSPGERRSSCP
jgi:hypothetical protein